jgi:predicted PurR-regulated permease PerM
VKQLAQFTAAVLATVVVVFLLWEFRGAVILFLLSLAVSAVVRPLVERLSRRGLPVPLALLAIYALGVLGIVGLIYLVGGPLIGELQQLIGDLASSYERIRTQWPSGNTLQQFLAAQLPPPTALSEAIAGERGDALIGTLLGVTLGSFDFIAQAIVILVLSVYWSADRAHFERLWLSLLPAERRSRAREIGYTIETGVGAYIRSEVIQSILAGLLLGVGYAVLGLKYPILLAVLGALAWLIPWVGVLLAVIPALIVGLAAGPLLGLIAAACTLAVLLFLQVVVEPRLFNRQPYSSLLVAVMVLVLADSFGVIGLILAPPLAAAIQIFFTQLFRPALSAPSVETVRQLDALRERLVEVRKMTEEALNPASADVNSLVQRVESLLDEADSVLEEMPPVEVKAEAKTLPGAPALSLERR